MTSLLLSVIFAAATRILVSQHQVKLVQHPGYHLDRTNLTVLVPDCSYLRLKVLHLDISPGTLTTTAL